MSAVGSSLSEPVVLAHAKRRLFPVESDDSDIAGGIATHTDAGAGTGNDTSSTRTYAVADTQFAAEQWLEGEPIDPSVRAALAPFNHVRLGGGFPDLVGVGRLESDLLSVERLGEEPPLIAVEAKGYVSSGGVDTHRGIVQAYDRLHEANVAYLAAPVGAISETDRTLARELNVGVLGVAIDGDVAVLETPRVVGNRSPGDAAWVRFQASAQGVTGQSFNLNHPKNYLGYPLAQYAAGPTDDLLAEYRVVRATEQARRGAAFLGLIDDRPDGPELTSLGREVVRFAIYRHGSVEAALEEFAGWYRSRKRFADLAPAWGQLARRVVFAYPATEVLVDELQCLAEDGVPEPSLVELLEYLHVLHPTFTVELFLRGNETVRTRVLRPDGSLRSEALVDGSIYHAPTVFQLKAMLYHAGILTRRGSEPSNLDPLDDVWQLRESLSPWR